jgi:hypothetical protein
MAKRQPLPIGLPVAAVILLVLGLVLQPVIRNQPEDVLVSNTILNGIPFILIFVAIVLFFISFIWLMGMWLNHRIEPRIHKTIEMVIIAGIVLGILGMFQPWVHALFPLGFQLLLISTLSFIAWSHIIPRRQQRQED